MPVVSETAKSPEPPSQAELDRILKLQVPVIVELARKRLTLLEVLRLGSGAILEFDKSSEDPLQLLINNKPIGEGETVKVGENFGLRITTIGDLRDKLKAMGGV